ncbi:DUF3553 domain-containing protein [Ketobacter sp.]|uniref:DUF3553 domain-containing protein n=1 Tax=Ketobacter sp. TaxID=2083498 RepID=UPI000F13F860|nr:DUF3553 domain-containing protein [Ketobacter sp.]RLT96987.1 MAG: DUF3553 domain-containing protein [Ketobacter sp.]
MNIRINLVLHKIRQNQTKIGQVRIWLALGLLVSGATLFHSVPAGMLLVGAVIATLLVTVLGYLMIVMEGVKKNLLWIPFFIGYHFIVEYFTQSHIDIIQLAAMTVVFMSIVAILSLRLSRYWALKTTFKVFLDQPLWKELVWPRYGRGFSGGSPADQAIHTILWVRKGNQEAAGLFKKLLPDIRELEGNRQVTLGKLREVVTQSNLKISKRQFDRLFSYEPSRAYNRIFRPHLSSTELEPPIVYKPGDRVMSPVNREWGVGEVIVVDRNRLWIFFVNGGVRTITLSYAPTIEKVSGRKAQHPGLDNINITKAELGIPEYFGYEHYVKNNARPALFLSKTFEDTGSLTYFGGRPMAPKGFQWPKSECYGQRRCMQFLGQIDLRSPQINDIDLGLYGDLPTDGILYFFIDEKMFEEGKTSQTVFYINSGLDDLSPVNQDGDSSLTVGRYSSYSPQRYRYGTEVEHTNFPTFLYPKFEVRMEPIVDIRDPYGVFSNYMFEIGRSQFKELDEHVQKLQSDSILAALRAIHGTHGAEKGLEDTDWKLARILDPDRVTNEFELREPEPDVSPIVKRWPQTWLHVSLWLSSKEYFAAERSDFCKSPTHPLERRFLETCENLVQTAEKKGPYTQLLDSERLAIRRWISKSFLHCLEILRERGNDEHDRLIARRISGFLRYSIGYSLRPAMARCLDLEQPNRDLLNAEEKEDFLSCFLVNKKDRVDIRHQMLGYGTNMQGTAEKHIDKVLLLQLYSDGVMSWDFADVGILQFWITKDDLRKRRFDKVVVTMEGC